MTDDDEDGGKSHFKVGHIEAQFNRLESNRDWGLQFNKLRHLSQQNGLTVTEARRPKNRLLNRYRDVNPYDHSRVILERLSDDNYINASFVPVEAAERRYILTQGPLPDTVCHLWVMVWEQKTKGIVMLNRLIEKNAVKCHQYWPDQKNPELALKEADLSVKLVQEIPKENYTQRTFLLCDERTKESRTVLQFHYLNWPDFGVPPNANTFLDFLEDVRSSGCLEVSAGPCVIHCSAGIGRSGTFCIVDSVLQIIEAGRMQEADINIEEILIGMRRFRMSLIQTSEQLRFSYLAIVEALRRKAGHPPLVSCALDVTPNNELSHAPPPPPPHRGDAFCSRLQEHLKNYVASLAQTPVNDGSDIEAESTEGQELPSLASSRHSDCSENAFSSSVSALGVPARSTSCRTQIIRDPPTPSLPHDDINVSIKTGTNSLTPYNKSNALIDQAYVRNISTATTPRLTDDSLSGESKDSSVCDEAARYSDSDSSSQSSEDDGSPPPLPPRDMPLQTCVITDTPNNAEPIPFSKPDDSLKEFEYRDRKCLSDATCTEGVISKTACSPETISNNVILEHASGTPDRALSAGEDVNHTYFQCRDSTPRHISLTSHEKKINNENFSTEIGESFLTLENTSLENSSSSRVADPCIIAQAAKRYTQGRRDTPNEVMVDSKKESENKDAAFSESKIFTENELRRRRLEKQHKVRDIVAKIRKGMKDSEAADQRQRLCRKIGITFAVLMGTGILVYRFLNYVRS